MHVVFEKYYVKNQEFVSEQGILMPNCLWLIFDIYENIIGERAIFSTLDCKTIKKKISRYLEKKKR